jgi:hypothetical protein
MRGWHEMDEAYDIITQSRERFLTRVGAAAL